MDEDNFRATYAELNPNRCCFEKSITSRRCSCNFSEKFLLASREGVKCLNLKSKEICLLYLETLRDRAKFALKQTKIDGPLPHKKEIKIQVGGLIGLQFCLNNTQELNISNIIELLTSAIDKYHSIQNLPYNDVIQSLVNFEIRVKNKSKS